MDKTLLFLEIAWGSKTLSREMLFTLWNHKCVRCRRPVVVVHEVIYRSMLPNEWMNWKNQVALCSECHEWAHSVGIEISKPELRKFQALRLEQYYPIETSRYLIDKLKEWWIEHA